MFVISETWGQQDVPLLTLPLHELVKREAIKFIKFNITFHHKIKLRTYFLILLN